MYKITIEQEQPPTEDKKYPSSTELYVQRVEHVDIPAITALVNRPQNLQCDVEAQAKGYSGGGGLNPGAVNPLSDLKHDATFKFRTTPDGYEFNPGASADEEHDSIEAHRAIHAQLHRSLDELVADFTAHNQLLLADTPILTLVKWSFEQTKNPTPRT